MNWYLMALKKYAAFGGRSQRAEYWFFLLVNLVFTIGLMTLDVATGTFDRENGVGLTSGLYSIALMVPSIAVAVRRLHDTGRSGWWMLIVAIPFAGAIILIVWLMQEGTTGDNIYGPDPREEFIPEPEPEDDQFSWAYKRPSGQARQMPRDHSRDHAEDPLDRLERLADMKNRGIISEEEYNAQKEKLLK